MLLFSWQAGSLLRVQHCNVSSVTSTCRSVPSNPPILLPSSQQEVYCRGQSFLWSSESARLDVSFFFKITFYHNLSRRRPAEETTTRWCSTSLMNHTELKPRGSRPIRATSTAKHPVHRVTESPDEESQFWISNIKSEFLSVVTNSFDQINPKTKWGLSYSVTEVELRSLGPDISSQI